MFFAQADSLHPRKWVIFLIESSSEICFLAMVARARRLSLPLFLHQDLFGPEENKNQGVALA